MGTYVPMGGRHALSYVCHVWKGTASVQLACRAVRASVCPPPAFVRSFPHHAEVQSHHDPYGQRKVHHNDDEQQEDAKVEETLLPAVDPNRYVNVPSCLFNLLLILVEVPQVVLRLSSHPLWSPPVWLQTGGRSALASNCTWQLY